MTDPVAVVDQRKTKKEKLPRGVRRRGNSLQVYLTHPDGREELRSLGMVSVKFAEKQRVIFQRAIAEGKYLRPVPRVERVLFSHIADEAFEHAKKYKRYWDSDDSRVKLLKSWWGTRFADEISTQEIDEKLHEQLAPRGLCWTPTTSNEYRVALSHIYKLAIDRGDRGLSLNPAAKAYRHKLNNARTRELTYAEEDRLRKAIREDYPHKEPELDLALHTGVRKSNIYGTTGKKRVPMAPLDWCAVDFDWKILKLKRSKSGVGYTVPLNETAMAALQVLRKRSDGIGPVVRKPSGLEIHSSRKWFEKCLSKAAIQNFCWHDLRHTFATRLRRNKVPLEDIAALLGHNLGRLGMTARYAHADMDSLHAAVATLVRKTDTETGTKTGTPSVVAISAAKSA